MRSGGDDVGEASVPPRGKGLGRALHPLRPVAWRLHSPVEERLPEASALLEWLGAAGLTDKPHVARLKSDFAGHPDQAKDFHRRAVELREAIYRLLRPQRSAKKLPRKALKVLNAVLNENTSNLRL